METFFYKCRGSVGGYNVGTIEAEDKKTAQTRLDAAYGVQRDASGTQTNEKMIKIVFCDASEFASIQTKKGEELTHTVDGSPNG